MKAKPKTIMTSELASELGAELSGSGSVQITGANSLEAAGDSEVAFLSSDKYVSALAKSGAGAVLVANKVDGIETVQLIVEDVNTALIKTLELFAPKLRVVAGVHPGAVVEESAQLGENVSVGAGVYIGAYVEIGDNCIISAGCVIEEGTRVGNNCKLYGNVVVYHGCTIGNNCTISANATIGATGFGYNYIDGEHKLIPHNGGVVLEDGVDIGANSCVDRAKFGNTIIGAGTKIDNLCQIAHNVVIGKFCLFAAHVGLSGSVRIGNGVVFGGMSGVADHMTVGDGAMIGGRTSVITHIAAGSKVFGTPPYEVKEQMRIMVASRRLPEMAKDFKKLVKRVDKLETSKDNR
ncbi:MAG: UDP-3-O-(3-hydroxymyristoyl)glucosamine N-acyltransferase [Planctomycetes bacterium]|nr:UDP-3-O-(3-hydroxymyristoyl)glucosamine N-acyltransferase [Planctomycetota bacterium]